MKSTSVIAGLLIGLASLAHIACSGDTSDKAAETVAKDAPATVEHVVFGEYVNPEDSLPRIRYFEGDDVSLNDRCPVRKVRINTKMRPAYVNGRPVGFC